MSAAAEFDRFIRQHRLTMREVAAVFGVAIPTVLDWRRGAKRPSDHYRRAIERWTHGRIAAESWMSAEEVAVLDVQPYRASA